MKLANSPEEVNFGDGRIARIGQGRLPTESSGSAGRQAAPSPRKPLLPPPRPPQPRRWRGRPGSQERGQVSAPEPTRAGLAESAELPRPLPRRARAPESCVKATPGPRSRFPARPTDCGTSSLLSAPEERHPPRPDPLGSQRSANSAGPGGQEGHRRACEQALSSAPSPSRASRRVRALTPGDRQPGPSRRQRPDAAEPSPAARTPPSQPDPFPRSRPGPADRPGAGPRPCAPSRLTCAPRRLRTSSPAPRAPSGHAPTPGPGFSQTRSLGTRRPPSPSPPQHKPQRRAEGRGQSPAGAKGNLASSAAFTPSPFTRPRRPEKMSPEAVPLGASLPPGTTEPAPSQLERPLR